ncbi:MAG: hypothetical protein IT235_03350, partial [Bacteroidia bacterium]|nr:hypothetical protein [Bacteroidia bacterium]
MLKKGDTFSASFTIDNKIYTGFIDIFDDTNFLHTNSSYAQKAGFKDKVMHGAILNGFLSHFIGMSLPVKNIFLHSVQIDYKKP